MTKAFQEKALWGRNNPLILYGNEDKLNDLVGRAFGKVVTQFQDAEKSGGKATLKLAAKLGGFLSALGLGEASAELGSELSSERTRTLVSQQTFERKLDALTNYCNRNEAFPYIDSFRNLLLTRDGRRPVADWEGRVLTAADHVDQVGHVLGLFTPRRITPAGAGDLVKDVMEKAPHLWLFESLPESGCGARIPVVLSNLRSVSQHAVLAFAHSLSGNFKLEAIGLCSWEAGTVTCDPLAWRLFY